MHNLHVSATQTVAGTLVAVSISETDEEGTTMPLATATALSTREFPELDGGSLEEFLEQAMDGVVKSLSTGVRRV